MANQDDPGRAPTGEGAGDTEPVDLAPVEVLAALARLDLESAVAYESAAELEPEAAIADQLRGFAHDHRRHVDALNRLVEAEGGVAIAEPSDPELGVLAGLARIAAPLGPGPLALTLLANEQLTNLSYEDALAYEWDIETEPLLERFRGDEERHMRWLSDRYEEIDRGAPQSLPESE